MLGLNPLPFQVGGGPTPLQKAYQTIRQAVGKGGSAENDLGIDGLWRRSRALGLVAATSSTRRALLQAFPHLATDGLPAYERILGILPDPDANEVERRDEVVKRWTTPAPSGWAEFESRLKEIDPRFSLLAQNDVDSIVTQPGRAFDSYVSGGTDGPPFLNGITALPYFSTRLVLRVRFTLGYAGAPTVADGRLIDRARELLLSILPSDEDFTISTGAWILGTTPIGLGAI